MNSTHQTPIQRPHYDVLRHNRRSPSNYVPRNAPIYSEPTADCPEIPLNQASYTSKANNHYLQYQVDSSQVPYDLATHSATPNAFHAVYDHNTKNYSSTQPSGHDGFSGDASFFINPGVSSRTSQYSAKPSPLNVTQLHPEELSSITFFSNLQFSTFTSLGSMVTFARAVLVKYTMNSSVLRMTLDCLDIWNSTIFRSLYSDSQADSPFSALPPHASQQLNIAFDDSNQSLNFLISNHVGSLLANPSENFNTYKARTDLYIQGCLVAGNISCVRIFPPPELSCAN